MMATGMIFQTQQSAARCRQRPAGGRGGWSMIETVIVVFVASSMLALVVSAIHTIMRVERRVSASVAEQYALDRLGSLLRQDVHRATEATVENRRLQLTGPDGQRVMYDVLPGGIRRSQSGEGPGGRREMFRLRDRTQTTIAVLDEPARVRLEVRRGVGRPLSGRTVPRGGVVAPAESAGETAGGRVIVFEPLVGRVHRFRR